MEKSVKFQAKRQSNIQEINRTSMTNDTEVPFRFCWSLFVSHVAKLNHFSHSITQHVLYNKRM